MYVRIVASFFTTFYAALRTYGGIHVRFSIRHAKIRSWAWQVVKCLIGTRHRLTVDMSAYVPYSELELAHVKQANIW